MPFAPSPFSYPQEEGMLFSIVVPVYNEQDNIITLVEEIEWVMKPFNKKWELLIVNDGSTDKTEEVITSILHDKPFLRTLVFTKNSGQTSALDAGFKAATGYWTITLDGDGQNDPRDIPLLIETAHKGSYDLVAGRRTRRQDPLYKRLISLFANSVRKRVLGDAISDTGCSLKLYRTEALKKIKLYRGMHRFLPTLFQIEGLKVQEISVHHRKRRRGKSKYHLLNRGISLFYDMLAVWWMRKRALNYEIKS